MELEMACDVQDRCGRTQARPQRLGRERLVEQYVAVKNSVAVRGLSENVMQFSGDAGKRSEPLDRLDTPTPRPDVANADDAAPGRTSDDVKITD